MGRVQGRITKEDIKSAGLRRWNGRQRITTDWVNLYHEPELCFPNGDCLVYLREPGQSSRGPSFRIHTSQLIVKGFRNLVDRAAPRPLLHSRSTCNIPACEGCDSSALRELYLPAPSNSSLDSTIDHHVTTRNFLAWVYNIPLAGRALGQATVSLKERLDEYRPETGMKRNQLELISFMEHHKYLDFRECVDHALAALHFAETLQLEDLWIDAFAHCVGMSHQGLRQSLEFEAINDTTRSLIGKARLEMDVRLDRVSRCVFNFFENDLSGAFLGLHQAAREHFDRFRSFLHAFYIEQHGFWPPEGFSDDSVKRSLYSAMYSDFRSLYHHLVDLDSTATTTKLSASGGVCTLQNIQAFDKRHRYEALPHPLPMLPVVPHADAASALSTPKRSPFNPLRWRQANREMKIELDMQALIDSSNRDWNVTQSLLVRRYSDFEQQSVFDQFEPVSVVDGRKVRWILIYAILQTLISVMQAPKQVRNTEGLDYSLCCHAPKVMPWAMVSPPLTPVSSQASTKVEIEPDHAYLHTSMSSTSMRLSRERERRSPPLGTSTPAEPQMPRGRLRSKPSTLHRLLTRRSLSTLTTSNVSRRNSPSSFVEIYVQGYGNGLNEVEIQTSPTSATDLREDEGVRRDSGGSGSGSNSNSDCDTKVASDTSEDSPTSTTGVSRESSDASNSSRRSRATNSSSNFTRGSPDMEHQSVDGDYLTMRGERKVKDENNEVGRIHFNTETWDRILAD